MKPEWFKDQIHFLSENGFHTISENQIINYLDGNELIPEKSIVIKILLDENSTRSDFENNILPVLSKADMFAFVHVNPDRISSDCSAANICWSDLIQWEYDGTINVQALGDESVSNYWLSFSDTYKTAKRNKSILESFLNKQITFIAYPNNYDVSSAPYLFDAGYSAGFSSRRLSRESGSIFLGSALFMDIDRYSLPSILPYSYSAIYPYLSAGKSKNVTFADMVQLASGMDLQNQENYAWSFTASYCKDVTLMASDAYLYLDKSPFKSDLSAEAISELSGWVNVVPSCYFAGENNPRYIVLHYSEGTLAETINSFRDPRGYSAHYIIDVDGSVVQVIPETYGAYHTSCTEINTCIPDTVAAMDQNGDFIQPFKQSIGIELINPGHLAKAENGQFLDGYGRPYYGPVFEYEEYGPYDMYKYQYWGNYTNEQISSLNILISDIKTRWKIEDILGHSDINAKTDPGPALEMNLLKSN